jgi:hypothetical protein
MITNILKIGLLLGVALSSNPALGFKPFFDSGVVQHIDRSEIQLPDRSYNLMATTKIHVRNKKGTLSDIKPGQTVKLGIIKLDNKFLVDSIKILKP